LIQILNRIISLREIIIKNATIDTKSSTQSIKVKTIRLHKKISYTSLVQSLINFGEMEKVWIVLKASNVGNETK